MSEYFDIHHYIKVRTARKKLGLYVADLNITQKDHELVGKKIKNIENNDIGIIEKVNKQWHLGWYLAVLANFNGSHALIFWENINCSGDMADHINYMRKAHALI